MASRSTANNDELFFDVHSSETIGDTVQGEVAYPGATVVVVVVVDVVVVVTGVVVDVVDGSGTVVVV